MKHQVKMTVNDLPVSLQVESGRTLLECLREDLDLTSPKRGCEVGECGACIVLLDGEPVNSCLVLAVECAGKSVLTAEGLVKEGKLHPVQQEFINQGAIQCGFCSPGMALMGKAILDRYPEPTEENVREMLAGNLCRCTGYHAFVSSIISAARAVRDVKKSR